MKTLEQAFKILDNFVRQRPKMQRMAIGEVEKLLRSSESKGRHARLMLRDIDQLQKQRAYMLIVAGKTDDGIRAIQSLVAKQEKAIGELHEEAAFQLAEAAIAAFRKRRTSAGKTLARSALHHAGVCQRMSRTVLSAIEFMQRAQEEESGGSQPSTR